MTDSLLALLPVRGPWLVGLATVLSCPGLPVPSSLVLIGAGAFVGSGDLGLAQIAGAALTGYVIADQAAFSLCRNARAPCWRRAAGWRCSCPAGCSARSRPGMTYAAAAAGFRRGRFTLASLAGAAIWVGAYLALGHVCGNNLQAAADLAGSALGLVAALAAVIGPGWWLLQAARSKNGD